MTNRLFLIIKKMSVMLRLSGGALLAAAGFPIFTRFSLDNAAILL